MIVCITGLPGIGKSRLLRKARPSGWSWLETDRLRDELAPACLEHAVGWPPTPEQYSALFQSPRRYTEFQRELGVYIMRVYRSKLRVIGAKTNAFLEVSPFVLAGMPELTERIYLRVDTRTHARNLMCRFSIRFSEATALVDFYRKALDYCSLEAQHLIDLPQFESVNLADLLEGLVK
jgi:hypothetical protein